MPRQARKMSKTGIFHIILRGINRQVIFEDKEDHQVFLRTIGKYKAEFHCQIFAYCLMGNHVHLLIWIQSDQLHHYMRKVEAKYVAWYNRKYDRIGGLFQDRFKSEPVNDDTYFLAALRYIHQNPVKAGICRNSAEYPDSSYHEYLYPKMQQITDTDYAISLLGNNLFVEFNNQENEDICMENKEKKRLNDDNAKRIILEVSGCSNASEFQVLPIHQRNQGLAELKKRGLTVRQIERLTGINRGLVQKAREVVKPPSP